MNITSIKLHNGRFSFLVTGATAQQMAVVTDLTHVKKEVEVDKRRVKRGENRLCEFNGCGRGYRASSRKQRFCSPRCAVKNAWANGKMTPKKTEPSAVAGILAS